MCVCVRVCLCVGMCEWLLHFTLPHWARSGSGSPLPVPLPKAANVGEVTPKTNEVEEDNCGLKLTDGMISNE